MMNFIADENVYTPIIEALRGAGHDLLEAKEEKSLVMSDFEIFKTAQEQNRTLLTMDKDFSNILRYAPGSHPGIIVLKLYGLSIEDSKKVFLEAFEALDKNDIRGNTTIIDRNKTRIRREGLR